MIWPRAIFAHSQYSGSLVSIYFSLGFTLYLCVCVLFIYTRFGKIGFFPTFTQSLGNNFQFGINPLPFNSGPYKLPSWREIEREWEKEGGGRDPLDWLWTTELKKEREHEREECMKTLNEKRRNYVINLYVSIVYCSHQCNQSSINSTLISSKVYIAPFVS